MNREVWKKPFIMSPSLVTFDLCNLERQMKELEGQGVEVLHVDILDGYFSPCMPLGLDVVRQLRARTDMAFDVHLMAMKHEFFVDELIDIGVQQIVFHIENEPHLERMLAKIKKAGVRAGVAMKPSTPLTELEYSLDNCDAVLLMLINPGYASIAKEVQVPYAGRKIRELRRMIDSRGLDTVIEIDGRVSFDNIKEYAYTDVNVFVGGTTCIDGRDIAGSMRRLKELEAQLEREKGAK